MGQIVSASNDVSSTTKDVSLNNGLNANQSSNSSSMEALVTEATAAVNNNENESLEVMAQKALECPCVAELRDGPCGQAFTESFKCFFKSTAEEKGSDCVRPFIALQKCIEANPDAFFKYEIDDKDSADGDNTRE